MNVCWSGIFVIILMQCAFLWVAWRVYTVVKNRTPNYSTETIFTPSVTQKLQKKTEPKYEWRLLRNDPKTKHSNSGV